MLVSVLVLGSEEGVGRYFGARADIGRARRTGDGWWWWSSCSS